MITNKQRLFSCFDIILLQFEWTLSSFKAGEIVELKGSETEKKLITAFAVAEKQHEKRYLALAANIE